MNFLLHGLEQRGGLQDSAAAICSVIVVAAIVGCGRGPAANTAVLAGTITIDGVPIQNGGVQFMPMETGQPAYSEVRDGAYSARVPKGRVRAMFSSVKETGRTVEVYSSAMPEIIDNLPPALREGMEITVTGDDRTRHFALSSKTNIKK